MSQPKKTSPATVAALGIAAIGGVGFAGWNISRAVSPAPAAPALSVAPAAATSPEVRPADGATSPAGDAAGTLTPAAALKETTSGEDTATLAPEANPFAPLPVKALPAIGSQPAPASAFAGGPLRPGLPSFGPPAPPAAAPQPPVPPVEEKAPELVGTLLGGQPSGVFRMDKVLAVVPVGASIGSWKVLTVTQGGAVIKSATRTLHLGVGGMGGGMVRMSVPPAPTARRAEVLASAIKVMPDLSRSVSGTSGQADASPADTQPIVTPQETPSPQSAPGNTRTAAEALPPAAPVTDVPNSHK